MACGLVWVMQAGRPVAFGLPHHQPLAVRGVVCWSARRFCSAMSPTACWQGICHVIGHPLSGMSRIGGDRMPAGVGRNFGPSC
ncbi:hypothetical protein B296_00045967 [Ensete ventricosum]|uniref:Uncharacterized protein n=1 Tax=Ensete ventricosum TaxID=4639 RepID=A0A426XVX8_ENSVE|nr:hypothetical protein B296_00045967 [Ensete ventricosum]